MQQVRTKGMTSRTGRGQSRKSQVIAMGRSRMTRLFARAQSYRMQIMGAPAAAHPHAAHLVQWHDIQVIPRTHMRNDIDFEVGAAVNALNRRELDLRRLFEHYGEDKVKKVVVMVSPYARPGAKGACELWRDIHIYLCHLSMSSRTIGGFRECA